MLTLYGCFEDENRELVGTYFRLPIYKLNDIIPVGEYTNWDGTHYSASFDATMVEGETMSGKFDWVDQFLTYAENAGFESPIGKIARIFESDGNSYQATGMVMKCVVKDAVNNRLGFAVGSLKHGIGLRFYTSFNNDLNTYNPVFMMMNPDLSRSDRSGSLDGICQYIIDDFKFYTRDPEYKDYAGTVLSCAERAPFAPYVYFSLNDIYRLNPYFTMPEINNAFCGLSYFNAWYLMLKGRHYKGDSSVVKLHLRQPINGIEEIELATTITGSILDNGRYTATTHGNTANVATTFAYFEPGTDLTYLFEGARPVNQKTIQTKEGINIELKVDRIKINNVYTGYAQASINLRYRNAYHMKYWMSTGLTSLGYDYLNLNFYGTMKGNGAYLLISPKFVGSAVSSWSALLTEHSNDQIENTPFTPATIVQSYTPDYAKNNKWGIQFMTQEAIDNPDDYPYLGKMFPVMINSYKGDPLTANEDDYVNTWINVPDEDNNWTQNSWRSFLNGFTASDMGDVTPGGGDFPGGGNGGPDASGGGGTSGTNGGNGGYDNDSDSIGLSDVSKTPNLGNMGNMVSTYLLREDSNQHDLSNIGTKLAEVTGRDWAGVSKIESIISLNMIMTPNGATPTTANATLMMGGYDLGLGYTVPKCTDSLIETSVGPIEIPEYFGSFLDYEPYTAIEIYLPFIGTKALDASEVIGGKLTLTIRQNIVVGTVTYILQINKNNISSARYSWTGDCSIPIPVSATNYSGVINGIKNGILQTGGGVTALAGGLVSGNVGVGIGGAMAMANGVMELATAGQKKTIDHTSGLSGVGGAYACMRPFISITRPKMSLPQSYVQDKGLPSNITSSLAELSGFTQVSSIHLTGLSGATEKEKEEIVELLKTGVIF